MNAVSAFPLKSKLLFSLYKIIQDVIFSPFSLDAKKETLLIKWDPWIVFQYKH